MARPIPYKGDEPYIFISYAHKDSALVWPIIERMQKDGYRVWYDEGIDPGTEWDENIADHVYGCAFFMAFLSPNYMASDNCKDELNFARDQDKKRVLVYLEDVTLPEGMALRLGRTESVRYDPAEPDRFYGELYAAHDRAEHPSEEPPAPGKKKGKAKWIILALVLLLVLAGLLLALLGGEKTPPAEEDPISSGEESTSLEEEVPLKENANVVLLDTDRA